LTHATENGAGKLPFDGVATRPDPIEVVRNALRARSLEVLSAAVARTSTTPATVSAAHPEKVRTDRCKDRNGSSGRISDSQSVSHPNPMATARTNHPTRPIVM
jgi:hypothetical protein